MKSFSFHTIAAAKLIEERGSQQFKTEQAIRLYHQLRRIIVLLNPSRNLSAVKLTSFTRS